MTSAVASVAHLVERHLAKVEVASSSLVTRSKYKYGAKFRFAPYFIRCHSQVVRQSSAKAPLPSSNLGGTSKTKGHPKGCPFVLGSAAQGAAPPFGISMLGVGKAAPAPRFWPAAKTLVRCKSGAAQKGRWMVFLQTGLKLKISI